MKGIILFVVSIVLTACFGSIGLGVSVVVYIVTLRFKSGWKAIDKMFLNIAIAIDQLGNVLCATLFNRLLITKDGYKFGNRLLTVSYVLGVNELQGNLRKTGVWLVWLLDFLDENHCIKAVEIQQKHDYEATLRIEFINDLMSGK